MAVSATDGILNNIACDLRMYVVLITHLRVILFARFPRFVGSFFRVVNRTEICNEI